MNRIAYILGLTLGVFVGNILMYRLGKGYSWETSAILSLLAAGIAATLATVLYAPVVKLVNWALR
jgi:predicted MFS family arabinose efflux permease